ncbi:MAG: PKD domain-containing protein [Methanobacteriota archaeon]|nr:MAG: PKD domain-containing protein [Euryarchaeota archaeon]
MYGKCIGPLVREEGAVQEPSGQPAAPGLEPSTSEASKPSGRRKWIIIAVVAIVIVAAVGGAILFLRSGTPTFLVRTTTVFATAAQPVTFDAQLTLPSGVTAGAIAWSFGDGGSTVSTGSSVTHTYATAGTFFVAGEANLSNGGKVNNFGALYAMYVGPRSDLTDRDSLGIITINGTASSAGAPVINPGGTIVAVGTVQQAPTYFNWTVSNPTPVTKRYVNYTWSVMSLGFAYGDGSSPVTNTSDQPLGISHAYTSAGLYALQLTVTTQNMSTTTDCDAFGEHHQPRPDRRAGGRDRRLHDARPRRGLRVRRLRDDREHLPDAPVVRRRQVGCVRPRLGRPGPIRLRRIDQRRS